MFLRNTGMSPSRLNFLQKMTKKRTLQNQLALSVRLKLWRRWASLRKRMRRIYLQSLKRGDSPGRGGRGIFLEQHSSALKTRWTQAYCKCCPLLLKRKRRCVSGNGQGWAFLPLLYLWWIILLTTTELGSPFPCLQYRILVTSFHLHFCRKLCRQEGRLVELLRQWGSWVLYLGPRAVNCDPKWYF